MIEVLEPIEHEHAPLVITQWWFWIGLILILLVLKVTIFRKEK